MLLFTLAALAHGAESATAYASNPDVQFVFECAPLGKLTVPGLSQTLNELQGIDTTDEKLAWLVLLDAEKAAEAGLDPEGALRFVIAKTDGGEQLVGSVGFTGDADQAEAFFRTFTDEVEREGARFTVGETQDATFELSDRQLKLVAKEAPLAPGTGPAPRVLRELPGGDACVVYVRGEGRGKLPAGELSMHFPLDEGASTAELLADIPEKPAPKALSRSHRPMNGSSVEAPLAVVTLGIGLKDLAELLPERPATAGVNAQIKGLGFTIKPGATFALSGSKDAPQLAGAMRVGGRFGLPHSGARVSRAIERKLGDNGVAVERIDRRTLRIEAPGGPVSGQSLFVGTRFGRLYLATGAEALDALIGGEGTPWLSPEQARFSKDWAFALQYTIPQIGQGWLGFGAKGPLWAAAVGGLPDENPDPSALVEGLGSIGALQRMGVGLDQLMPSPDHGLIGDPGPETPGEPEDYVTGLCIAELAYDAAFDKFVPVDPWPVAPEGLGPDPLPGYPLPPALTELGWRPEVEQVWGSYSVEVAPDGASARVHGHRLQDGVMRHVVADTSVGCTPMPADAGP